MFIMKIQIFKRLKVFVLAILAPMALLAQAQESEKVKAQVTKDFLLGTPAQYEIADQEAWWTARTESSPNNSASWLGLYKVVRYKDLREAGKNPSKKYGEQLLSIEEKLNLIDPNSFECQLVSYENRFMSDEGFFYLNKAAKLRPENIEIQDDLAAQALFNNEFTDMRIHLQKLRNSEKFNDGLLEFHKALLKGLTKNSVIITHGYADTYALLILQQLDGIRKDVEVVSVDHLINDKYREKKLEILGVPSTTDIPSEPYLAIELLRELSSREIFVATTFPEYWLKGHRNSLYFEGLAYRWSTIIPFESFDPVAYYESFVVPESIQIKEDISRNYLPLLIQVRNITKITGRMSIAEKCESIIRGIASQSSKSALILQKLEE